MRKLFVICISLVTLTLSLAGVAGAEKLQAPSETIKGLNITYEYTSGRAYHVKFGTEGVSYRYLSGQKPDKWWGPFPFQAFEVESQVFMAAWFEENYGDYVTLLINLNNKLLYGSAILGGKNVHFHGAQIVDSHR